MLHQYVQLEAERSLTSGSTNLLDHMPAALLPGFVPMASASTVDPQTLGIIIFHVGTVVSLEVLE
jgi:hypothetical protein